MDCLWTTLPPIWSEGSFIGLYSRRFFLCHCQMRNITLMNFDDSSSDSFFAPSWSGYCLLSFLRSTILPLGGQRVEKCWCHFCQGFCKLNWCSYLKIFIVQESNLILQRSCLFKSNCWNEIRKISVFENYFWSSSFFGQRPNTLFNAVLWLSCILKTEMTRCKI